MTAAPAAPPARPPKDGRVGTQALLIGAAIVVLVASFAIGALVNGFTSSRNQKARNKDSNVETTVPAAAPETSTITDLNLVPATGTETIGTAMTSPPLVDPDHKFQAGFDGGDATALSSQEYSRMTQQPVPVPPSATVDPRTIQPPPVAQAPPVPARPKPAPQPPSQSARDSESGDRKEAVPISQPLPNIEVDRDVTVRLDLTIGADGRVKEVDIIKGGQGVTARVISKVQSWRFRPATVDGRPVESRFPVEIYFNGP